MVFNATFNNISAILFPSILLVEETEYLVRTTDLLQVTSCNFNLKRGVIFFCRMTSLQASIFQWGFHKLAM